MADELDPGDKIRRIEENLRNPRAALTQIGAIVLAEAQDAFKQQAWNGKAWKPRKVPNVFGIISDFYEGKTEPPARRFVDRPALRDTNRLASTLSWAVKNETTVEIGSNLPYASAHQFGKQVESKPITADVQSRLYEWLKKKGAQWKSKLGFLLNKKYRGQKLTTTVPKRQFVGLTKQTREDIYETIGVKIYEVKNGGGQ